MRRARSWRYGTSSANTIPVAGALKIAATPAAAPHTIKSLLSSRLNTLLNRDWSHDPIDAPM